LHIRGIELRRLRIPFVEAFNASYGGQAVKDCILVFVETEGAVGVGECAALADPYYLEETVDTAWLMLERYLGPALLGREVEHPAEVTALLASVRGQRMAKAGLESAVWHAYAQAQGVSLAKSLGGKRSETAAGVSLGLYDQMSTLLQRIDEVLSEGYQRVKVKIAPQRDVRVIAAIRAAFGDIPLSVDANGAYTLADSEVLRALDDFGLAMIEQPLAFDDLWDHAQLQRQLTTPICLDESIRSAADARKAIAMGACRVMCVKYSRVGGLQEACNLVAECEQVGIPVWCGGMYETGVGRLATLAVASLTGVTWPGDLSPSARYFAEDIILPPVAFTRPGWLAVPTEVGLGAELQVDVVARYTRQTVRVALP